MDPVAAPSSNNNAGLTVEISKAAPRDNNAAATLFAARGSKCAPGDMMEGGRCDAAAPPTAATCPGTFTFADFLDTVNPLQHIPVLSSAYRAISGDTISPTSNIAGGTLYGGIFGGLAALAGSMLDILQGAGSEPAKSQIAATSDAAAPLI